MFCCHTETVNYWSVEDGQGCCTSGVWSRSLCYVLLNFHTKSPQFNRSAFYPSASTHGPTE